MNTAAAVEGLYVGWDARTITSAMKILYKQAPVISRFLRPAFSMNGTVTIVDIPRVVVRALDRAEDVTDGRVRYFSNTVAV